MTTETAPTTAPTTPTTPPTAGPLFNLGQLVITPGIRDSALTAGTLADLIRRHRLGSWDMSAEDIADNMAAIDHAGRIFGAFTIDEHTRIWIITEADRSSTCVLLPSDY